jgi:hypothetical protein
MPRSREVDLARGRLTERRGGRVVTGETPERAEIRADHDEGPGAGELCKELEPFTRTTGCVGRRSDRWVGRLPRIQSHPRILGVSMAERTLMFRTQVSAISKASPEAVYDTIADLRAHLEWSGERASDEKFKLLSLEAPGDPATVGTTFTSSGAAENGTFHDRSVVTEASRPHRFAIETDSRLERRRGRTWEVHFSHRYDIEPDGDGSRIVYTETAERANYVPYWLHPLVRPIFRPYVNRADRKQLQNLARLAEERSTG